MSVQAPLSKGGRTLRGSGICAGCLLPTRALTGEEIEIISDSVRLDVTGHRVDFKAAQRE